MLQVSRRIAEEVARVHSDDVVLLRFFDIEKAYPRVCRAAIGGVTASGMSGGDGESPPRVT